MKNLITALVLVIVASSCNQKRPDVIENPVFETWSSEILEIKKSN